MRFKIETLHLSFWEKNHFPTSKNMLLFLVCLVLLLSRMYCLNCCRLSSTACCNSSPPLAAPLKQPSPEIDLSSSTQDRSLARLPRRCWSRTVKQRDRKTMKMGTELELEKKKPNSKIFNLYLLFYHKRQKTLLLPADGEQTKHWDSCGSIQTAGQGQEIIQSIADHLRRLRPVW